MRNSSWCWRRRLDSTARETWIERLDAARCATWAFTERPGQTRILLEAWFETNAKAQAFVSTWGGQVRSVNAREWIAVKPTPPTRIVRRLEIIHDEKPTGEKPVMPRLVIPHGVAFGSGEHGTTYMLLRALAGLGDCRGKSVLDLGTGSGVLALAARLFGATKIMATDFDPDSVRTAKQNEVLNFPRPLIRWKQADVLRLKSATRCDLVLANIFSGILIEAAPRITACVAPRGQLWLSGILTSQQHEVTAAYRAQGLKLVRAYRRGKWIMLALEPARLGVRKSSAASLPERR